MTDYNYNLNDKIIINNLLQNTNLNNQKGLIIKGKNNDDRYGVCLESNKKILIKSFNLKLLSENSKQIFWCLHDSCLESKECFYNDADLEKHMKIHEI